MKKRIADVWIAPMTHWDRAWYQPFEEMRGRLVDMIDGLLDVMNRDRAFASFSFDGQSIPFEDYLAIRPQARATIQKLVRSGRLAIGPWYVLPDAYLVSGEALVRNLQIGMKTANALGKSSLAGYIPDPFGYPAALPSILAGFGIDSFIFSRGAPEEAGKLGIVFRWVAPDGASSVMAIRQIGAYWHLSQWGSKPNRDADNPDVDMEKAMARLQRCIAGFEKEPVNVSNIFVTCGVDHQPVQPAFPRMLAEARKRFAPMRLHHASFDDYLNALRKEKPALRSYSGELHSGWQQAILTGTISARMWIKQENFACQRLLEAGAEPLDAFLSAMGMKPSPFLEYCWKELIKTHPHDDICGCSVDAVHDDNRHQFRHVKQAAGESMRLGFKQFIGSLGFKPADEVRQHILIVNPDPRVRGIVASIDIKKDEVASEPRAWRAVRLDGKPAFSEIIGKKLHLYDPVAPACGYALYAIERGVPITRAPDLRAGGDTVENRFLRARLHANGSVDLLEKAAGRSWRGLNLLEDTEDAGDEYDYSPVRKHSRTLRFTKVKGRVFGAHAGALGAEVTATFSLRLPESLKEDRSARSDRMVDVPVEVTIRLRPDSQRLEFTTTVTNIAKDHRLRAHFPTGVQASTVRASSHFDVIERACDMSAGTEKHNQPTINTQHMDEFVAVQRGNAGALVVTKGLPEYEAIEEKPGVDLAITLLRCCGWLSRGDLVGRTFHAGPPLETPGAQCQGTWTFEYAFIPYSGDLVASGAAMNARQYTLPAICHTFEAETPKDLQAGKMAESWLSIDRPEIVLSSIKRPQSGKGIVVRVYNPDAARVIANLKFAWPLKNAMLAKMDETPVKKLPAKGADLRLALKAKEVVTVVVEI